MWLEHATRRYPRRHCLDAGDRLPILLEVDYMIASGRIHPKTKNRVPRLVAVALEIFLFAFGELQD